MKISANSTKIATEACVSSDAPAIFDSTLKILGDFWTIRILESLMEGSLRYCEIERALKHVNPVTLSKRLKTLEENDFIVRQVETIDRQSVTYELTSKGKETRPVVEAIKQFSLAHPA